MQKINELEAKINRMEREEYVLLASTTSTSTTNTVTLLNNEKLSNYKYVQVWHCRSNGYIYASRNILVENLKSINEPFLVTGTSYVSAVKHVSDTSVILFNNYNTSTTSKLYGIK